MKTHTRGGYLIQEQGMTYLADIDADKEGLERIIFVGQALLRLAIDEYVAHYRNERNHQGLEDHLIRPDRGCTANDSVVQRRSHLGGMLNYYYQTAV